MTISSSLYTSTTGLENYGSSLGVIGHNVANINTVGFKASRPDFANLVTSLSGEIETGHGVNLTHLSRPFLQGAVQTSDSVTDLAIEGPGLFIVNDEADNSYYTRAGQFTLDVDNNLVNAQGLLVQGFQGGPGGALGNITIDRSVVLPGTVTSAVSLQLNLDATSSPPVSALPPDAVGTEETSTNWFSAGNFSTALGIFDSSGAEQSLIFLFRKAPTPNQWEYRVLADSDAVTGGTPDQFQQVSAPGGLLAFNADGTLNAGATNITAVAGINWANGATTPSVSLDFSGTTQFGDPSSVFQITQNGNAAGGLRSIVIDRQGVITGQFSNGGTQTIAQVALANFASEEELEAFQDTLFLPTVLSGAAEVGAPESGGLGSLVSGATEASTVDLATEFVGMILFQRAFQVNSRAITIADEMYQEAVNLKQ
jgi:flagellar hook protein FlgE